MNATPLSVAPAMPPRSRAHRELRGERAWREAARAQSFDNSSRAIQPRSSTSVLHGAGECDRSAETGGARKVARHRARSWLFPANARTRPPSLRAGVTACCKRAVEHLEDADAVLEQLGIVVVHQAQAVH